MIFPRRPWLAPPFSLYGWSAAADQAGLREWNGSVYASHVPGEQVR